MSSRIMEKNKVIGLGLPGGSSGESDSSDWAVIDEDTSLEWNDEAKYHFRHSNSGLIIGQSVKEESSQTVGFGGEVSDDDSIEVVSDDPNDDNMSTKNHWVRPTKKDLENVELVKNEALSNETSESQDSEAHTDMIWYPVREKNGLKDDVTPLGLSIYKTNMKQTSNATVPSWLLSSYVLLAIIFAVGLILGYSCRSFGTVQINTGPDVSDSTVKYGIMVSKLNNENELLRWKLRNINYSCLDVVPSTTLSLNTTMGAYRLDQSSRRVPVGTCQFKTLQDSTYSSTNHFIYNQHKINAYGISGITHRTEKKENHINFVNNFDISKKEIESEVEPIILESVTFEEIGGKEHYKVVESNIEANITGTKKIDSLLTSYGRSHIDTEKALLLSVELMEKIDIHLQLIDSMSVEHLPLRFKSKMAKFSFSVNKIKRKLDNKIDESIHKLAFDIQRKVEGSKRDMLKKLCDFNNILVKENISLFEWSNKTMISKCNTKKNESGRADLMKKGNEKVNKFLKSSEKFTNSDGKPAETKHKKGRVVTEMVKKACRPIHNNKDSIIKEKNEHLLKDGIYSNIDISDIIRRNERKRNLELHQNNDDMEKFENTQECLNSEHKISNVSGEWLIKMGKGREEQRNYEHKSDWLFDRAESRKIYRYKVNVPVNKGSSRQNGHHSESDTGGKVTFKEQVGKYWKNKRQLLKKMIPKTIVGAAESVKKAFNNLQRQKKVRARQR